MTTEELIRWLEDKIAISDIEISGLRLAVDREKERRAAFRETLKAIKGE